MRRHTPPVPVLAAAAAATLLLAGCGGGPAGTGGTGATDGSVPGEFPDELTVGFAEKIATLDPNQAIDQTSLAALGLYGAGLYRTDDDGRPQPLLVESGEVTPDGLEWTFVLEPDLVFSDGSPLTAADVAGTFEAAKADPTNMYAGFVGPIETIEVTGDDTVVLRLNRAYPALPVILTQPHMAIFPAARLADRGEFFRAPVSAGPYTIDWDGGPTAEFTANDNYAGEVPGVPSVSMTTVADSNTRLAQAQSGELDLAYDIPPAILESVQEPLRAEVVPLYGFISMPFNNDLPPFTDVKVRQAVSAAIDRQQINEVVWSGETEPVDTFWPSTMSGFEPAADPEGNPDRARELLIGTECENGCEIELMYSAADTWGEPLATIVDQSLAEIGIDVSLREADDATVNQALGERTFQMAASFLYDYNDVPDGMLVYGLTADGGLEANFTGFQPPADLAEAVTDVLEATPDVDLAEPLARINELFATYQPFATVVTHSVGTASRHDPSVVHLDAGGFVRIGPEQ